jgi:hypothetical protein
MLALKDEITPCKLICSEPISFFCYQVSFVLRERSMLQFCYRSVRRTQRTVAQRPESYFTEISTVHIWDMPLTQLEKKNLQLSCLVMLAAAYLVKKLRPWKGYAIVQLTKCAPLNLYLFVHLGTAEKTLHCHLVSQWKTSQLYQGRYPEDSIMLTIRNRNINYAYYKIGNWTGMLTLVTSTRTCSLMNGWYVIASSMLLSSVFMLSVLLLITFILSPLGSKCDLTFVYQYRLSGGCHQIKIRNKNTFWIPAFQHPRLLGNSVMLPLELEMYGFCSRRMWTCTWCFLKH